jgi:hypothetical protein
MDYTPSECLPELNFPESILIRGNDFDGYSYIQRGSSFYSTVMQIEEIGSKLKFLCEWPSIRKTPSGNVVGSAYLLFYMEKVGMKDSLPSRWVDVYSLDEEIAFKKLFTNILRCSIERALDVEGKSVHKPDGLVHEFLRQLIVEEICGLQFYMVQGIVGEGSTWNMKNVIEYRRKSGYNGRITDDKIKGYSTGERPTYDPVIPHLSVIDYGDALFAKLGPMSLKIIFRGGKTKKSNKKTKSKKRRSKKRRSKR